MRNQDGYTLAELMLVLALMALMAGLASTSGTQWVSSARTSRSANELVDYISLARERAIAGYEQWRITFATSSGEPAQSYVIDHCRLTPGQTLGEPCLGAWVRYRDPKRPSDEITTEPGVGIVLKDKESQVPVSVITFDRSGYFLNPTVDARVCGVMNDGSGLRCREETGPLVRIHTFAAAIELCRSGECAEP